MTLDIVQDGHLGGYARANEKYPHGDPDTWFPELWQWLIDRFGVKSVLDVGCGEGHAVKWFLDQGIHAVGVEGSHLAIENSPCPDAIIRHDFTNYSPMFTQFTDYDLIWACEFVEHIEAQYTKNFIPALLLGKVLAMTHAFPGQPGYNHVNCQETVYWVNVIEANGFRYDHEATIESRRFDAYSHWQRSGLIFRRND